MGPATRDRVKRGNENPPHPTQSDVRRSKRVTRSQSQGLDDDDSDSPPRSRPLRRGRQPSVELGDAKDSGTEKAKRSGRNKRKRQKSPASKLPAVSEEPSRKSPGQDSSASIPETRDGHQLAHDTSDDHANISGTTFLADSFDASGNLDSSLMLEVLPQLLQASTNLLNFLTPPDTSERRLTEWICNLRQEKLSNREHLRLSHHTSLFETSKSCFGSHNYIDIPSVARSFSSNSEDTLRQNPNLENVLHLANLATLASYLVRSTDSQALPKYILSLSSTFPLPFMSATSRPASEELTSVEEEFLSKTFNFFIDFRTQCLILSLESQSTEDSSNFSVSQEKGHISQLAGYTGEQLIEYHFGETCRSFMPDTCKGELRQRTKIIHDSFGKEGQAGVALIKLRENFPWKPFMTQLAVWIRLRAENISRKLRPQGSLDGVVDALRKELDHQNEFGQPSESPQPIQQQENGSVNGDHSNEEVPQEKPPHVSDLEISQRTHNWAMLNASSVRLLKQREIKTKEIVGELELQGPELDGTRRAASPSGSRVSYVDSSESEGGQQPPVKVNRNVSDEKKKQGVNGTMAATKGKSRNSGPAFIDPQEDARKVSPISLEDSTRGQKRKKRSPELSDVEESQDDSESEAYQQDERRVDIERNKKRKPNAIIPSKKRPTPRKSLPSESGRQRQTSSTRERGSTADAVRRSISSSQSDDSGDSEPRSEGRGDFQRAKEEQREPKQQTRRKWTEDEAQRLIKLVGKVGTSWSLIKQKDEAYADRGGEPKLTARNQVQLKDKARNMVMDFYKSGRKLPKNFNKVSISQNQIDKLAALNIEYP